MMQGDPDEQFVSNKSSDQQIDPKVLLYLRQADATFRNGFDDDEMKNTFLQNVFEEIVGNQKKLSYMKSSSFIMDNFMAFAKPQHLLNFFEEVSEDILEFSDGQCSCHVLQKALERYITLVSKGNMPESCHSEIRKHLVKWSKQLKDPQLLSDFVCGGYSTHVARSYFQALAGVVLPTTTKNINNKTATETESKEIVLSDKQVDTKLLKCFKNLVGVICSWDRKMSIETFTDVSGSPFVSTVLKVSRLRSIKTLNSLCAFIVTPASALANNNKQLVLVCKDKLGSHIMETLFEVGSKEACLQLYDVITNDDDTFMQLVLHSNANFVIQRMLSCRFLQFKERFSKMYKLVSEAIPVIYGSHKMGVIQKLAEQCLIKKTYQKKLYKSLLKLFECEDEDICHHFVYFTATSSTYPQCKKALDNHQSTRQVTYHGSLLVQALLKFDESDSQVVEGLMRLSKEQVLGFIKSAPGSHMIDEFFNCDNVQHTRKQQFLNFVLQSCVCEFACDKYGSRIVENLFKSSPLNKKLQIVEALAEHADVIGNDRFGRHIHRNLAVRMFVSRPDQWRELQQTEQRKKRNHMNGNAKESGKKQRTR